MKKLMLLCSLILTSGIGLAITVSISAIVASTNDGLSILLVFFAVLFIVSMLLAFFDLLKQPDK